MTGVKLIVNDGEQRRAIVYALASAGYSVFVSSDTDVHGLKRTFYVMFEVSDGCILPNVNVSVNDVRYDVWRKL